VQVFAFNLAAPFVAQFFSAPLLEILPYADILFGNEHEAAALADAAQLGVGAVEGRVGTARRPRLTCPLPPPLQTKDLREVALKVAGMPKTNGARGRVVVFTQGAHPTLVVENGVLREYPVLPIAPADIVDSNGAGDAFVGGYLAQLVRRRPRALYVRPRSLTTADGVRVCSLLPTAAARQDRARVHPHGTVHGARDPHAPRVHLPGRRAGPRLSVGCHVALPPLRMTSV
jgi:sugar/nucleoside kinase (ribokinase family)